MVGSKPPLNEVLEILRSRKQKLAFAESCTGGLLSATVTSLPGVSDVFLGSVVSYANEVKVDLLKVAKDSLMNEGAVSERVALEMAHGAQKQLKSDWAVAITGVAGPSGGSSKKPVGTVWFAIVGPEIVIAERKLFVGDRGAIRKQAVDHAISFLKRSL